MKKQLTFCLTLLTILCTSTHAQLPSYLPADGLVGWWPFNGNANDESGNGNDGVVNGATLTEDRNGLTNSSYYFDVNNWSFGSGGDYIYVPYNPSFNFSNFTISTWVKRTSAGSTISPQPLSIIRRYQYGYNNPNGESWVIEVAHGSSVNGALFYGAVIEQSPSPAINFYAQSNQIVQLNQWCHVVMTYSQNTISLYLDNQLVGTASDPSISINTVGNSGISIGLSDQANGHWAPFDGSIDDIAIYNRALTEQEIQNLYTGTNTTTDTGDGSAPLPQGIPYQAAARDGNGQPVVNSPVTVRFSLHEGAADGATSYIESHSLNTNSIGLFNTVFGNGTPEQSAFDSINWAATTKFLQVEVDLGNGYVDMGTTQLLSVPYAFRSAQAANIKNAALPVYSDNAAALAGGLVAGEMYRTPAGVLMIAY